MQRAANPKSKAAPSMAERGLIGARRRWGPPRRVRLDDLTDNQREAILKMVEAFRAVNNAGVAS